MKFKRTRFLTFLFTILLLSINSYPQDTTSTSLAYKSTRPNKKPVPFFQPDLAYRIWHQFNLIREANAGNAFAQHELGLRYLLGDGVYADTAAGAMWIKKAADQNVTAAIFNYGILLLNGWGVEWNPFEAFDCFKTAAESGMAQAQHIVGLFYTDNLIVKRDWQQAYKWVKQSADKNYRPAEESLTELLDKIPENLLDTASVKQEINSDDDETDNSLISSMGLVFIDFDFIKDSMTAVTDNILIDDLKNPGNEIIPDSVLTGKEDLDELEEDIFDELLKLADNGSPEALTILGRLYETGTHYKKDFITAAAHYIRAVRFDSPTAGRLLYDLCKDNDFIMMVQRLSDEDNPEALFVWYGITVFGFNVRITESDAISLLKKSASKGFIPAINELGLNYYTGNMIEKDKQKAVELWESVKLENPEADSRIATGVVFGEIDTQGLPESVNSLKKTSAHGSVLAQVALGYAYENGRGLIKNKSEAVKYYRNAAQRGNRFAYTELKRLYDEIRPPDSRFKVN